MPFDEIPDSVKILLTPDEADALRDEVSGSVMGNENAELCKIIKESKNLAIQYRAAQEIMENDPTEDELCVVIFYVELLVNDAWIMLKERNPSDVAINKILRHVKMLRDSVAFFLFCQQKPRNACLVAIILYVNQYRDLASEKLLDSNPSNGELLTIIQYSPSFRTRAWFMLIQQGPVKEDIVFIIEHIPELSSAAQYYMEQSFKDSVVK
tara:strand:- start:8073 stop:8702 length:630 start_codon:yes stop_codon:yes gene_type:complete